MEQQPEPSRVDDDKQPFFLLLGFNNANSVPEISASPSLPVAATSGMSSDSVLVKEIQELKETVQTLRKALELNTKAVVEQLVKMSKLYDMLFGKEAANVLKFPLTSMDELDALEDRLTADTDFETKLKMLIKTRLRRKVSTKFSKFLTDTVLSEINWDGRKHMKSISSYRYFKVTLYECWHTVYSSFEDYVKDVKEGIKRGKKRTDQRRHQKRKANRVQKKLPST